MTTRAPSQSGFTLIEILAALVVFGFLMLGLTQAVRYGMSAWTAQSRIVERNGDLDAIDRLVRGLVEHIEPARPVDPPNIVGTPTSFAFTSLLPAGAGGLATRGADMLLRVDADRRLILRWTPRLHAQILGPPTPPETDAILSGIVRAEFSYFSQPGGWRGQWNDRTPPLLIKVRLVFAPGDVRHWPEIVVAPQQHREDG